MPAPTDPERILLVGDTHANTACALAVIDHAAAVGADVIVQVGDFGFWPRAKKGRKFLRKVEWRLAQAGIELWFVDGNHEDHDALGRRPIEPDGRRRIDEHLPRGFRWTWDGTTWLAAGGGASVDRTYRMPGVSWFPQETLTDVQVAAMIDAGPAEVVVAHDCPMGTAFLHARYDQGTPARDRVTMWPAEQLVESDQHQARLRWLVDGMRARTVIHGHHHVRFSDTLDADHGPVSVEGLGLDGGPLSQLVLLVGPDGKPVESANPAVPRT